MSTKCFFCYDDGSFCKKWARTGSRFCGNHQPVAPQADSSKLKLHPYARLTTEADMFQLVSESLNALRLGAMTPEQVYAMTSMLTFWLKLRRSSTWMEREAALRNQILPTLLDAEAAAEAERLEQATAEVEQHAAESERDLVREAELALIIKHGPAIIPFLTGAPATTQSDQDPPSAPIAASSGDAPPTALAEISDLQSAISSAPATPREAPSHPAPAAAESHSAPSSDAALPPSEISNFKSAIPCAAATPTKASSHPAPTANSQVQDPAAGTSGILRLESGVPSSGPRDARRSTSGSAARDREPDRNNSERHRTTEHERAGERGNGSLDEEALTRAILKQLFRPRRPNNSS